MTNLRRIEGGASNSRLTLTSEKTLPPGLDTVRLRYRCAPGVREALHESGPGWESAPRGELRHTDAGVTVGAYPDGLVYVEGRLAALLHGEEDHRLLPAEQLDEAAEVWRYRLRLAPDVVEVGRADVTGELMFDDPEDGLDVLSAFRSVDVPWLKIGTEGFKRGELQTVYGRSARGRSVVFRVYDKGVETGHAPPGRWLRFERQKRFRKDRAMTPADFAGQGLRSWFVGRELSKLIEASPNVTVCDSLGAVQRLRELQWAGTITGNAAERLAGYALLHGDGLPAATRYRRAAELRRLGISVERDTDRRVTVPVPAYLRRVADSFAA